MAVLDLGRVVGPQGPQGATGAQGVRGEQGLPGPNQLTNQTATPLTGVIVGNGSVVGVRAIDDTPTADSTGFPTSGGVKTALDGKVPAYGMGKNLLDNWYFLNPVNQRGASSYSTDGAYTLDRWKLGGAAGTASVSSQGVLLTNTTAISQFFEQTRVMSGKTYTMSVLWSNGLSVATGTLTYGTQTSGWQIESGTVTSPKTCGIRFFGSDKFQLAIFGDGTNRVIAAKVELGTEQTLAHQENGEWVLNEIPDYAEELRKCQKYYLRILQLDTGTPIIGNGIAISTTQAAITIPTPVTMRSGMTASFGGTVKLWHGAVIGASAPSVSGIVGPTAASNAASVTVSVASGLTIGEACALQLRESLATISLSSDL